MPGDLPENRTATADLEVTPAHTAAAAGSGDLQVLATPAMAALMEQAACRVVQPLLSADRTTVGTALAIRHFRPTPVGARVTASATLIRRDGAHLTFHVSARDGGGEIGAGTHERVMIRTAEFLERLAAGRGGAA